MLRRYGEKERSTVVGPQRDAGRDNASSSGIRTVGFTGAADGAFGRESKQGVTRGGPARGSRPLGRGRAGRVGRWTPVVLVVDTARSRTRGGGGPRGYVGGRGDHHPWRRG